MYDFIECVWLNLSMIEPFNGGIINQKCTIWIMCLTKSSQWLCNLRMALWNQIFCVFGYCFWHNRSAVVPFFESQERWSHGKDKRVFKKMGSTGKKLRENLIKYALPEPKLIFSLGTTFRIAPFKWILQNFTKL